MFDALKKKFLIFHLDNFLIPVQYKRLLDTLRWIGILLTLTHVFVVCLGYYILWMGNLNTLLVHFKGSSYTTLYLVILSMTLVKYVLMISKKYI